MKTPVKHAIFISYRRADTGGWPGRLEAQLVDRFGAGRVFRDIRIPAGADYAQHIEEVLDGCRILLAIIGPGWTTLVAPDGTPRLLQPDDLLREELERALGRPDVTVIPVLVGGAAMPASTELPASLRPLAKRQATVLTEQSWDHDMRRLEERICGLLGEKVRRTSARSRRRFTILLAVIATVVAVATGMFTLRDGLFPKESGSAAASLGGYERAIGSVCTELGVGDRAAVKVGRRLRKRLRAARTLLAQRNALLDAVRTTNARSAYELALFKGISVPSSRARRHGATLALWHVNQRRIMAYRAKLDGAGDKARLDASVRYVASIRRKLVHNGVDLRAGLVSLGGGSCALKPPVALDTITLPRLSRATAKPRASSSAKPGASSSDQRTVKPGSQPGATPGAEPGGPTDQTPEERVAPPPPPPPGDVTPPRSSEVIEE